MQLKSYNSNICDVHIGYDSDAFGNPTNEQWAVAAAMFSRSTDGIQEILNKITADKSSKFLDKFYIGYGHGSVGDLVNVKLFIEKVPLYVACMLEHHSRFVGQESSTRYLDFSKQRPAYDADLGLYKKQISTYLAAVDRVTNNIKAAYDPADHWHMHDQAVVERAIKARAFDICRSLLPWGATTNVAWYGNIRAITQHLAWLNSELNPNREYTNITPYVEQIYNALQDFLPSSVTKVLADTRPGDPWPYPLTVSDVSYENGIINEDGDDGEFLLDFGSWRDLNRHRIGKHTVDLNTRFSCGFHSWYETMLAKHGVEYKIPKIVNSINERLLGEEIKYSYYCPREQLDYLVFRRGQDDVHPTLRNNILYFASITGREIPPGEEDPGAFGFFLRRGTQTITIRAAS